ncbi:MAG: putative peptidoglycan lipid flippase [Patescibacteria group bacterium]|nr:putative peptidoglycan lipid flippase [Patescibacteria group bacterium]
MSSIIKGSAIIAFLGVFSQFLGLVRDRLLASHVGIGINLDSYYTAFRVPDFIYGVVLAFIGAVTILPLISSYVSNKDDHQLSKIYGSIFNFFTLTTIGASVVAFIFMPQIVSFFAYDNVQFIANLSRILLIQVIILSVSNLFSVISQAYKQFLIFALAPIFYNIGIIIGVLYFYKSLGVTGIVYGVVLGALMHLCIQSITIIRSNIRFSFNIDMNIVGQHFKIAWPRSLALGLQQLRLIVITFFASLFGEGALSIFTLATALTGIPVQFIGVSYATASYPVMSEYYENQNHDEFNRVAKKGFNYLFLLGIASSIFFFLFSFLITKLILNASSYDTYRISLMVSILSYSIVTQIVNYYLGRVFFATRHNMVPLISQFLFFTVMICVMAIGYFYKYDYLTLGYAIVSASFSEFLFLTSFYYLKFLFKK